MSWVLLIGLVLGSALAALALLARRSELRKLRSTVEMVERATRDGSHKALLQQPVIDLSRCLGCGTCVSACPEDDVLELVHGQAVVAKGAHCVGTAVCEKECPTGAIVVTLADLEERDDVPAVSAELEAIGTPGLFLAGEVTAHALIRTAIDHGRRVADAVAGAVPNASAPAGSAEDPELLDLCIVGAGPAGIACALGAKGHGLSYALLDQESKAGGTVAKYPRRKLVLTQPVEMPGYGRLKRTSYVKEELVELWDEIVAEQALELRGSERYTGLESHADGTFTVHTETEAGPRATRARHVCLAIGRRGTPRMLGIEGEELTKVAYSLLDAQSYTHAKLLVVGGGDSAVEAALGLAEQPGNEVTLSYRREAFFRIRSKNQAKLERAIERGKLAVLFQSQVVRIEQDRVELNVEGPDGTERRVLPNDEVFVLAGGIAPFELLKSSGVSFDASLRPAGPDTSEQGTGLLRALALGLALSLGALAFALLNADYYLLETPDRPSHPKHDSLRPGLGLGLGFGIASVVLILGNLAYLLRRSPKVRFELGSLKLWMTAHVGTGVLAVLCAMLHGAMAPGDTVGGHAFLLLSVLLLTGVVGRYLYSYVPRAANGRELELLEVRAQAASVATEWGPELGPFGERAKTEIESLIERRQWKGNLPGRVLALFGSQHDLRATMARLNREARQQDLPQEQIDSTLALARRAHGAALGAAHFEDLRGVVSSWRYLHRWGAALMVALVVLHVIQALRYSASYFQGSLT